MPGKSCACGAIPSACCRKTSWPPTNSTFIDVLSFCTRFAVTIAPRVSCTNNGRILLVNPLQSSRSTFSRGSLLSFFAFKEGMLGTPISVLGGWPTVSGRFVRQVFITARTLPFFSSENVRFTCHWKPGRGTSGATVLVVKGPCIFFSPGPPALARASDASAWR